MSAFDSICSSSHPPPSIGTLQSWLKTQNAYVHPGIDIVHDESFGLHVVARDEVEQGALLCMIPKKLAISHRTSSLAKYIALPPDFTAAQVTLHLAACLLHEIRLGTESPFWPALQMLPRDTIRVPTFWGHARLCGSDGIEAMAWLRGTNAEEELRRKDREGLSFHDIEVYFADHSHCFPLTQSAPESPALDHYLYALAMVFTRGYVTDAYHTIALVPFCDLFNHSSNAGHTSLLSDQCVCPTCGSLSACEHDPPGADRVAHLSAEYISQTEREGRNVEMRAEKSIRKGEQIFSCYEEGLDDGKLLVEWGFTAASPGAVRWNPNEVLRREDGRAYLGLWQRGVLAASIGDGSVDLVYLPDDPGDFGLRPDGQLSMNVALGSLLPVLKQSGLVGAGELEEAVCVVMDALNGGQAREEVRKWAGEVRQAVRLLLRQRLDGMHPCIGDPKEVARTANAVETYRPLTQMAMRLSSGQRRSLLEAARKWSEEK